MFALLLLNLELSRGGWMQKRLAQNKHCAIIQHFRNAQLQSRRFQMSPDERTFFEKLFFTGEFVCINKSETHTRSKEYYLLLKNKSYLIHRDKYNNKTPSNIV